MRRARAWARCSTGSATSRRASSGRRLAGAGALASLLLAGLAPRPRVQAERREVVLAAVLLLQVHLLLLAALVEARLVGPYPPQRGEHERHAELPQVAGDVPGPAGERADADQVRRDDQQADDDEEHGGFP